MIFNVNWLGDVLFSTPVIRNIRRNYPDSFIACVIPSRCYPVLKGNPHLDEVIIFDEKDRHQGLLGQLGFVKTLKEKKFDRVFLLHRSLKRALICRLAGIPERIGYNTKRRAFLLSHKIEPPNRDAMHRIDYYLNVIEKSGVKVEDRYLEFFVGQDDEAMAKNFLKTNSVIENDFLVGINPGGNWLPKRWPVENWARLADKLISELGCKLVITGSSSDVRLVKQITAAMLQKPILAVASLNIKQFAALCKKLDIFITADTGPLHIANAVGAKKIIALFGPTSPMITGAFPDKNIVLLQHDVGCKIPCYVVNCPDNRCMKAITVEDVMSKIITKNPSNQ